MLGKIQHFFGNINCVNENGQVRWRGTNSPEDRVDLGAGAAREHGNL
jgi:hypothetical protein